MIQSIHRNIELLTDVTYVDFSRNQITDESMDSFAGMKSCKNLKMPNNLLESFPYSVNTMRAIDYIDLSDNNRHGKIHHCDRKPIYHEEDFTEIALPWRREGTFLLLPHADNGFY